MRPLLIALAGGGLALVAAALGSRKASASERGQDRAPDGQRVPEGPGSRRGVFRARLTSYYPLDAKPSEKRREGPPIDRLDKALNYLEDGLAKRVPWVSVSGDKEIFPYGQALRLDAYPGVLFRVVDTGENFTGWGKEYREPGAEPLDIAVRSHTTRVPEFAMATMDVGNTLEKKKEIAVSKFKGQTVVVGQAGAVSGYHILGGLRESCNAPLVDCVERGRVVSFQGRERFVNQEAGEYTA